jgi:hypothetical protein
MQGLKKKVFALNLGLFHQRVHKSRFANIRIANQGNDGIFNSPPLSLLLLNSAKTSFILNLPTNEGFTISKFSPFEFKLRFSFSSKRPSGSPLFGTDHLHGCFGVAEQVCRKGSQGCQVGSPFPHKSRSDVGKIAEFYLKFGQFGSGCYRGRGTAKGKNLKNDAEPIEDAYFAKGFLVSPGDYW